MIFVSIDSLVCVHQWSVHMVYILLFFARWNGFVILRILPCFIFAATDESARQTSVLAVRKCRQYATEDQRCHIKTSKCTCHRMNLSLSAYARWSPTSVSLLVSLTLAWNMIIVCGTHFLQTLSAHSTSLKDVTDRLANFTKKMSSRRCVSLQLREAKILYHLIR